MAVPVMTIVSAHATPKQLLADAGPLLASSDALRRRVVRAVRGAGSFTIGFMPGLIVTEAVRALAGTRS
jgi:hypothetical protein